MLRKYFALFFLFFSQVFSNVRAPNTIPYLPSSSLWQVDESLIVEQETLDFRCGYYTDTPQWTDKVISQSACQVSATYSIQSNESKNLLFKFISQSESGIEISLNEQTVQVENIKTIQLDSKGYHKFKTVTNYQNKPVPKLYEIGFQGTLVSDKTNQLTVKYLQPMGAKEVDYGYSTGEWQSEFSYELWPLKEWKLKKDFKLQIAVTIENLDVGFFDRLFDDYEDYLICKGMTVGENLFKKNNTSDKKRKLHRPMSLNIQNSYKGNQLKGKIELNKNFPDRLVCFVAN